MGPECCAPQAQAGRAECHGLKRHALRLVSEASSGPGPELPLGLASRDPSMCALWGSSILTVGNSSRACVHSVPSSASSHFGCRKRSTPTPLSLYGYLVQGGPISGPRGGHRRLTGSQIGRSPHPNRWDSRIWVGLQGRREPLSIWPVLQATGRPSERGGCAQV